MSWARHAVEVLGRGEPVQVRPRGHSMQPKVNDGDRVSLEPVPDPSVLEPGDIVLVKVRGTIYLHLILARDPKGRFLIGNNRGGTNGWVGPGAIYGKAVRVERGP